MATLPDQSVAGLPEWAATAGDITDSLNTFFDDVLVMAEDPAVRAARLGLLQSVVDKAPAGIDWKALFSALG